MDRRSLTFLALFAVAGVISTKLNFASLVGSTSQFFTLFQFFAPIAGGFLGGTLGAVGTILIQSTDFLLGKELNLINALRLMPLAFAALYFSSAKESKLVLLAPVAAIAGFLLHPVGSQVPHYALILWTFPIIAAFLIKDNLLAKSLGATLTAHAIGGLIWIYTIPTTPAYWNALIPIVVYERLLFAVGIAASYVTVNAILSRATLPEIVKIDRRLPFAKTA